LEVGVDVQHGEASAVIEQVWSMVNLYAECRLEPMNFLLQSRIRVMHSVAGGPHWHGGSEPVPDW
jgi:hypothetical protein